MSRQIQIRRGDSDKHQKFTGAIGEVTMDTTKNTLRVHDGTTVGGNEMLSRNGFYSYITNCITEIPQDIKLELANGVITLKAGSKVTFPDGTTYTLTADKNRNSFGSITDKILLMADTVGNIGADSRISRAGSGATLPADSSTYGTFYNSSDNKIYHWTNGWTPWGVSLPIAIINLENGIATSIDQVFNGFGYIGSTVFALPGVKGLIPNGRNDDGTLKNITAKILCLSINTITSSFGAKTLTITSNGNVDAPGELKYNPSDNYNYNFDIKTLTHCDCGSFEINNNYKIVSFEPKTVFSLPL